MCEYIETGGKAYPKGTTATSIKRAVLLSNFYHGHQDIAQTFVPKKMRIPIVRAEAAVLRMICSPVEKGFPQLHKLIHNMWDTMQAAHGCGLAAPQVNVPIRLFVADMISTWRQLRYAERERLFPGGSGIRQVFINPAIIYYSQETWKDEEGCLSIPGQTGQVSRSWEISIRYFDQYFHEKEATFAGYTARVLQHEFDHLEGRLYTDYGK